MFDWFHKFWNIFWILCSFWVFDPSPALILRASAVPDSGNEIDIIAYLLFSRNLWVTLVNSSFSICLSNKQFIAILVLVHKIIWLIRTKLFVFHKYYPKLKLKFWLHNLEARAVIWVVYLPNQKIDCIVSNLHKGPFINYVRE